MADAGKKEEFEAIRNTFLLAHGLTQLELTKRLVDKDEPLSSEWREALKALPKYCVECHKEHKPTPECVESPLAPGVLHRPMPPDISFDFKGWRFRPPFHCMNCGREIHYQQFAFCRGCGRCDVGKGPRNHGWFAGPHELIGGEPHYSLTPERFRPLSEGPLPYPKIRRPITPRPPFPPRSKPPIPRRG